MALTDQEKLVIAKEAFIHKLNSILTWGDFKIMIGGLTKTKIKNFVQTSLQDKQDWQQSNVDLYTDQITDIEGIKTEIEEL